MNNYFNNIILYFLTVLILHLLIKIYLLEDTGVNFINAREYYNAGNDTYGDMIEMGILDPTKVTRSALQFAASIASLMITTECMITDAPVDAAPAMPDMGGMGGGMGGMGGMM